MLYDYSIVVPVYNGSHSLRELHRRVSVVFAALGYSYEIIFVEDCGSDDSWKILCELKAEFPEKITTIRLGRNFGQHSALLCGFQHIRGRFVVTLDDDLQTPPEEIPKLIARQQATGADLVYGIYRHKRHNIFRNMGSMLVAWVTRYSFEMKNNGTSFRLFTADIAKRISAHKQRFVYVDGLIHWYTQYVEYEWVNHASRQQGRSGYNFFKLLGLASSMLFNFTTLPLQIVVWLGIFFSSVSFIIGVSYLFRKLFFDVPVGYTSIAVGVFFMGGVILLVLGVIGQYLSRMLSIQNEKPAFSIKEKNTILISPDIVEQTAEDEAK